MERMALARPLDAKDNNPAVAWPPRARTKKIFRASPNLQNLPLSTAPRGRCPRSFLCSPLALPVFFLYLLLERHEGGKRRQVFD